MPLLPPFLSPTTFSPLLQPSNPHHRQALDRLPHLHIPQIAINIHIPHALQTTPTTLAHLITRILAPNTFQYSTPSSPSDSSSLLGSRVHIVEEVWEDDERSRRESRGSSRRSSCRIDDSLDARNCGNGRIQMQIQEVMEEEGEEEDGGPLCRESEIERWRRGE